MFMIFVFLVVFVVIPIVIFLQFEDQWTIVDAFYFVFVSLTTIGLGDYYPGQNMIPNNGREVYILFVSSMTFW